MCGDILYTCVYTYCGELVHEHASWAQGQGPRARGPGLGPGPRAPSLGPGSGPEPICPQSPDRKVRPRRGKDLMQTYIYIYIYIQTYGMYMEVNLVHMDFYIICSACGHQNCLSLSLSLSFSFSLSLSLSLYIYIYICIYIYTFGNKESGHIRK